MPKEKIWWCQKACLFFSCIVGYFKPPTQLMLKLNFKLSLTLVVTSLAYVGLAMLYQLNYFQRCLNIHIVSKQQATCGVMRCIISIQHGNQLVVFKVCSKKPLERRQGVQANCTASTVEQQVLFLCNLNKNRMKLKRAAWCDNMFLIVGLYWGNNVLFVLML